MSVDVEEIFPLLLAGASSVVAIAGDRCFPNRVPQTSTLPAVIWRRLNGGPVRRSDGKSNVSRATFQVESWSAASQEQARELNKAVQGIECRATHVGDWWIQALYLSPDADADDPQIPTHADDLGLFCSVSEFTVIYKARA